MAMLDEARQGAQRVSTIVRELRSFSRAADESRTRVDLATVVQSGIKIAGHEIRHKARIVTSFEPARPVWGNEARLEQVVINLLLNAAQAMPETRAEHNEIRVSVRADSEGRAVLEVFDNATASRSTCCRASSTRSTRPSRSAWDGPRALHLPRHRDFARRAHRRIQ